MIEKEFRYYLENQDELVSKYNGKYIVIKDNKVVETFKTEEEAFFDSIGKYEAGTFMIQKCTPGNKDYTQTFHSRAIFV